MKDRKFATTGDIYSKNTINSILDSPQTIIFFAIFLGFTALFVKLVHPSLQIPFVIFSLLVAIFLTRKSEFNKKRRLYVSLLFLLKKDNKVYRPYYQERRSLKCKMQMKEKTKNQIAY